MDNENKIDKTNKSKKIFLRGEIAKIGDRKKIYSLNDEFAKTKKNKNYFLIFIIIGFIAAVFFTAYIITTIVEYRNNAQLNVEVSEFKDVRLNEILSSVKIDQKEINQIKDKLREVETYINTMIKKTRNKYSKKRAAIEKKRMSKNKKENAIEKLNKEEAVEINKFKTRLKNEKKYARNKISTLNKKIKQHDAEMKKTIRKAETMVNNMNKLHNLKMQAQRRNIIAKYDPWFASAEINAIINKNVDTKSINTDLKEYNINLLKEGIWNKSDFNKLRNDIKNYSIILNGLQKVPYRNSVSRSIDHIEKYSVSIINDYEEMWYKLAKRNESYNYALEHHLRNISESGLIIDPRDPENIVVQINNMYTVGTNSIGLVFRKDDEYIGKVKFIVSDDTIKAKAIEIEPDKELKPFDKILIQFKEKQSE